MLSGSTLPDPGILEFPRRRKLAENGVLAMALVVFVEVMLFTGFISAYIIVENSAIPGLWPPPNQPRLPVERTAVNTAALLASGVALWLAHRAFRQGSSVRAARRMGIALLLGAFFVVFQGIEWLALIRQGLTMTSSQLGSFFYLIVGAHAIHAMAALVAMAVCWRQMRIGRLTASAFGAIQLFWYFVVLMWPVIYWKVYL
jgi:heme/copper-type cytochrome/quinol oxidase subunit 3